jgi:hydroxymethylglutaryl-CoA reductase (NADPH)
MPTTTEKTSRFFAAIANASDLIRRIKAKLPNSLPPERLPLAGMDAAGTEERLQFLREKGIELPCLTGKNPFSDIEALEGNIENYIGMSMVPTGVVGPLHIIGTAANGDFFVPLATSEGALVASYDRGVRATRMAGGVSSICLSEGVQRSPIFKFESIAELGAFLMWVLEKQPHFQSIIRDNSRFAELLDMKTTIEGNHLILTFEFVTGDASGQNMVTICTDAICQYIIASNPVKPTHWFIESNYSGDKKATALSFSNVRGKKVISEVHLPQEVVEKVLRTTSAAMAQYWQSSTMGVIQSGAIGAQGHVANGLCALFIATGQDAACTAEAAVGVTRMEVLPDGGLYASLTLPNLIVGTVGGGTGLPTQQECLRMLGCEGTGKARKFAEICGALALAGELSIAAALSAGHFTMAHKKLGRKKS